MSVDYLADQGRGVLVGFGGGGIQVGLSLRLLLRAIQVHAHSWCTGRSCCLSSPLTSISTWASADPKLISKGAYSEELDTQRYCALSWLHRAILVASPSSHVSQSRYSYWVPEKIDNAATKPRKRLGDS